MRNMNSKRRNARGNARRSGLVKAMALTLAVASFACVQHDASASPESRRQAKEMYDRLVGTPPTQALLNDLEGRVFADPIAAGMFILDKNAAHSSQFYTTTLKNFATPWTNRDQTVFAPLNDYTATVIGMVRDDVDFRTALSADVLYTVDTPGLPAVSANGNDHYDQAEQNGVDLKAHLVATQQSTVYGTPAAATAGLITTRAASAAFFIAGTNRAMFRFTLINHLCRDMEQVHDTTRPPDRIRQDVSR